ncbi:MAG: type II toxin-antitoxin system VapC family toxin [Chloroflexi bacterium]|nr:type II toxin-antitoxin system VapC family toxin [Chloroflexota bacterium]
MKNTFVLDAFAMLAFLQKENGYERVRDLLSPGQGDRTIIINAINTGEVYYILARERSVEEADFFIDLIVPALNISVELNDMHDVIAAAKIKAVCPISYADAFATATAQKYAAALVTGDPDFKHVEKLIDIEWL